VTWCTLHYDSDSGWVIGVMPEKVLLLEDDADQLEMLAMALSLVCGRESVRARSYADLTKLADSALACGVALLDVNLGPRQPSGLDAYRWLREHQYRGRIYFLTGHARSHPLVAQALAMGDAKLVEKPIATDQLCALVAGSLHE
jgi:DNA-binding NtrC family response regulator